MNAARSSTLLLFMATLFLVKAQWFIIKKDFPSTSMNYPNPGKRSPTEEELKLFNIDCLIPYTYLNSYEEKLAWILSCSYDKSPLTKMKDSSSSSSNSIEDDLNSIGRYIPQDRRTQRSIPPYIYEYPDMFKRRRLFTRLHRFMNK